MYTVFILASASDYTHPLLSQWGADVKPHLLGLVFKNSRTAFMRSSSGSPYSSLPPPQLDICSQIDLLFDLISHPQVLPAYLCRYFAPLMCSCFQCACSPAFSLLPQCLRPAGFCLEHSVPPRAAKSSLHHVLSLCHAFFRVQLGSQPTVKRTCV